ncbi:hypothetical protein ACIG56_05930 [Nocardia fusca]|uniref:hypothetical protein n=1 Tax=Nocardia fusca TaxID=941183 RepID=UPI0037C8694C
MFRTNRVSATRRATARLAVAGAITLVPLAGLAAPAVADPGAPAPGYTQVDRDRHRDHDRDRHWDHDRDRHWDHDRHRDRGWQDPAGWVRHLLRGLFGSS